MSLVQNIDGCLEAQIGPHGLSDSQLQTCLTGLRPALERAKRDYETGALPHLRVPEAEDDIEPARAALERLSEGAQTIVFFGTGGSSLGGQTLAQSNGWNIPGYEDNGQKARPRTRFFDNLDGATFAKWLENVDLASTRFVVTSKSGNTGETLTQTVATFDAIEAAGLSSKVPELFLGLSEPAMPNRTNHLRSLFESRGIPMLEHHTGIGGRYSCLTNVGLLPAMARGLDPMALRKGAKMVVDNLLAAEDPADVPSMLGAALNIGLYWERNVKTSVMLPYTDRLERFSAWFVQLWAESLGKGGEGLTPVAALGPVDQHSSLQLFLDGPYDKLVTVIRGPAATQGPVLDAALANEAGISEMAGRRMGELVAAQQRATPQALINSGRPARVIDLPGLDEVELGGFLMHFMLETIFAAALLDIDPFDQPAVEQGKILAKQYLSE